MNYLYLITLIWFSKTLCAKHYLVETKDSYTDTTPSSNLQQDSKQNSKILSKLYQSVLVLTVAADKDYQAGSGRSRVNCGGHEAVKCKFCPYKTTWPYDYVGSRWCNGECQWSVHGECVLKGKKSCHKHIKT